MLLAHKHSLKAIALFNCPLNHAGGNVTNKIYINTVFFFLILTCWVSLSKYSLSFCRFDLLPHIYCHLISNWRPLTLFVGQDYLFSGFSYSSGMSTSSLLLEDRFWNIEFLVDYFGWLWFLVFVFLWDRVSIFSRRSWNGLQDGLQFIVILLLQPSQSRNSQHEPPCLVFSSYEKS